MICLVLRLGIFVKRLNDFWLQDGRHVVLGWIRACLNFAISLALTIVCAWQSYQGIVDGNSCQSLFTGNNDNNNYYIQVPSVSVK